VESHLTIGEGDIKEYLEQHDARDPLAKEERTLTGLHPNGGGSKGRPKLGGT
jgi:hypothetical protein